MKFKKYFQHLLKKNLLSLACLTLLFVVLYVVPILIEDYRAWNGGASSWIGLYYDNIIIAFGVLSVLIPMYSLAYKMNKRSVDMYYSLPISRTKILLAHYLVGLILLYASYTFAYFLGLCMIITRVSHLNYVYYLPLYFASLIPAFMLYTLTAFLYTRANTVIDGVVTVICVLFVLPVFFFTVNIVFGKCHWFTGAVDGDRFFPFGALIQISEKFGEALTTGKFEHWFVYYRGSALYHLNTDICELVGDVIWFLLAVAATVALFMTEKNCKAENCGQISESIFSYKVLIPVYLVLLTMVALKSETYELVFVVAFGAFLLSILYKRNIKIGWKFAIVLGASFMGAILLYCSLSVILEAIDYSYPIYLVP